MDHLLERFEPTAWGAVVTDSRFPLIYDANYARVDRGSDHLRLAEVEAVLLPALEAAGASSVHVVTMDPGGAKRLLDDLEAAGGRFTNDTAMRFEGPAPPPPGPAPLVEEVSGLDDEFWDLQRRTLPEFDISHEETIDQFVGWQRGVLASAGKRWFGVRLDGAYAGFGSLFVREGAAYVDNVVTFPHARRRGVAGAIITRMVEEARAAGAPDVYLLADEPGPIRLYRKLGFVDAGTVVGSLRPRASGLAT